MPAILGDNLYIVIGVLIVIASVSWIRKPLWKIIKRGLGFSGNNAKTESTAKTT
jgi:hypothetical protein